MSSGFFTMQWLGMKQSKYGIVVIGYSVAPSWQALEPLPHTRFTGYLYLYNEFWIYILYFLHKALCITCITLLIHHHLGWFFDLISVALYFIQSYLLNIIHHKRQNCTQGLFKEEAQEVLGCTRVD